MLPLHPGKPSVHSVCSCSRPPVFPARAENTRQIPPKTAKNRQSPPNRATRPVSTCNLRRSTFPILPSRERDGVQWNRSVLGRARKPGAKSGQKRPKVAKSGQPGLTFTLQPPTINLPDCALQGSRWGPSGIVSYRSSSARAQAVPKSWPKRGNSGQPSHAQPRFLMILSSMILSAAVISRRRAAQANRLCSRPTENCL
jgi:hypothetical protein